jgi:hypothetical protein
LLGIFLSNSFKNSNINEFVTSEIVGSKCFIASVTPDILNEFQVESSESGLRMFLAKGRYSSSQTLPGIEPRVEFSSTKAGRSNVLKAPVPIRPRSSFY